MCRNSTAAKSSFCFFNSYRIVHQLLRINKRYSSRRLLIQPRNQQLVVALNYLSFSNFHSECISGCIAKCITGKAEKVYHQKNDLSPSLERTWESGREDSNLRPLRPERSPGPLKKPQIGPSNEHEADRCTNGCTCDHCLAQFADELRAILNCNELASLARFLTDGFDHQTGG